MEIIFAKLSSRDRKRIRLVCKLWYDASHRKEPEFVVRNWRRLKNTEPPYKHIENCGCQGLSLCFGPYDAETLPTAIWEKIGTKIHTLNFTRRIGNQIMKNVILLCDNLKTLRIDFRFQSQIGIDELFCSPETLESLNVVRQKLETFQICVDRNIRNMYRNPFPLSNVNNLKWKQIFEPFLKIYPNIVHYSLEARFSGAQKKFRFAFSKNPDQCNRLKVASILAVSLTTDVWSKICGELSELRFGCYFHDYSFSVIQEIYMNFLATG